VLHAQSLAAQGPAFAVDTYLAGSGIAVPGGRLKAGTRYVLVFDAAKTAAGVAAAILTLRFGATGSVSDAALGALTFPVQTAVVDDGRFSLEVTFRSSGTAAVVQAVAALTHTLSASGLANVAGPVRRITSAPFDATLAAAQIGVSLNGGAAAAWTVSLVQARLENLA
jgi:Zn-dependent alcohol dehydrogenase